MRSAESGIYIILNTKNGKIYIGSTVNFKMRWKRHRYELNKNIHINSHLQYAWDKYGAKAFQFKVLEYCSIDQLEAREDHFLSIYMPKGICYNIGTSANAAMRGRKHSEATKRKVSEARKGIPHSEETCRKLSEANKGKHLSEETRRKMSEAAKNRSEKTRRKISEAAKENTDINGHIYSEGTRRKIDGIWSKKYIVISPEGIEFEIKGLKPFCRENNLDDSAMLRVAQGKRNHHKGWTCRKVEE